MKLKGIGYKLKGIEQLYGIPYHSIIHQANKDGNNDYIVVVEDDKAKIVRVCNDIDKLMKLLTSLPNYEDILIEEEKHKSILVEGFKLNEIKAAEKSLGNCLSEKEILQAQLKDALNSIEAVQAENEGIQSEFMGINSKADILKEDKKILQKEVQSLEDQIRNIQSEYKVALEREVDKCIELSDNLKELKGFYATFKRRSKRVLKSAKLQRENDVKSLKEKYESRERARNGVEVRELRGWLTAIQSFAVLATVVSCCMVFGIDITDWKTINPYNALLTIVFSGLFVFFAIANAKIQMHSTQVKRNVSLVVVIFMVIVELILHGVSFDKGLDTGDVFTSDNGQKVFAWGLAVIISALNGLAQWFRRTE